MIQLLQRIWMRLYGQWALWFIRKERTYAYAGLRVTVPPGVFHPGLFFSTPIFIDFLEKNANLDGKRVLDVGTGSGMLALYAARKGAQATAVDINPLAVVTARQNAQSNQVSLEILESDLFKNLPKAPPFDFLLVNPPYFEAHPKNNAEQAFFAGENLEYFTRFFAQVKAHIHPRTKTWMILSNDCNMVKINEIATSNGFNSQVVARKEKWGKGLIVVEWQMAVG